MLESNVLRESRSAPRFSVELAGCGRTVVDAQKLRYRVFAQELGARLEKPWRRLDEDSFDRHCKHLVVRDDDAGEVVGTYRILAPDAARRAGGYYAEREFDLSRLECPRDRLVEIGRACVHPDYRAGSIMLLLWSALARYVNDNGYEYVMGSASVGLAGGGDAATSIYRQASRQYMSPIEYRVFPRHRLPLEDFRGDVPTALPPLLRGYLNVGAWVCGEPAWDIDFNCADLPILLPMSRMHARFARHFLEKAA